jgi:hypothetical protein
MLLRNGIQKRAHLARVVPQLIRIALVSLYSNSQKDAETSFQYGIFPVISRFPTVLSINMIELFFLQVFF